MGKPIIYFLCTGNSCRSQMAEGLGKEILGSEWDVYSAGIEAHGINSKAVEMMDEIGIDIGNQESQVIDQNVLNESKLVITLCGDAKENCPVIPTGVETAHWGLVDPAKAEGTEEEVNEVFRDVRDEIKRRIEDLK
ncbi:arsenate reductase (thioredoxin) [Alkalibacillus haloalkaliphilus]|uniref:arsenate reductase (thioredoxin) n=1 Tax=Alkalibacillus haloalkaliphilus TaxID=94136 RepID=UPI002935E039|nr:arsenate reductase (thioredoxin) [Alkalibacillus haloalkaliphilus]MDV2583056.1 arsenate reductase (thioredoxin) [Alkalibacillus haloalkaliphilus]